MTHRDRSRICLAVTSLFALAGCYGHSSVLGSGDEDDSASPACLRGGECTELAISNVDKVDLLFVVDNSESMQEEHAALQREFPRLIEALTTGVLDGRDPFPPAEDLHLGIVSGDMGLIGITGIPGCDGLGDDGILNDVSSAGDLTADCHETYPRFLTYLTGVNDSAETAHDLACLSDLGTNGCGIQQPFEAALKALWPSVDVDVATGQVIEPNRILFLGDSMGFGTEGHGDLENDQFLRNDPTLGRSLIAVVVVTDDEDCSSRDTSHLTPNIFLDLNDPRASQPTELRCFHNPENLYDIERHVTGLRALRPSDESLVVFAAIVGVPADLVGADYDAMLDDPRMQPMPSSEGRLEPSCSGAHGDALPPVRIVELAREFGEQGVVQSICEEDFGPAVDAIVDTIAAGLGAECLPDALARDADGLVACDLIWELPAPGTAPAGTPITCADRPYLTGPRPLGRRTTQAGGEVCVVHQLAVEQDEPVSTGDGADGWYYDDFSSDVRQECADGRARRIAFTPNAKPETGVRVVLDCAKTATD